MIFICENNLYGMALRCAASPPREVYKRARRTIDAEQVDGMDVTAMHEAVSRLAAGVRAGMAPPSSKRSASASAPTRWPTPSSSHEGGVRALAKARSDRAVLEEAPRHTDHRRHGRHRDAATADAMPPMPRVSPKRARTRRRVADPPRVWSRRMPESPTARRSAGAALQLQHDDRVFLMGEDIGAYGGSYAVTKGFSKNSAKSASRTHRSPNGDRRRGNRRRLWLPQPMVELMTINFSLLAIDQIVNNAPSSATCPTTR